MWKSLKEMGIPDHLTCILRNLYVGQEVTVRTGHGTADWFQIGKGVHHRTILSPCLFNLHAGYIMRNAGLDEAQAGIKIAGRHVFPGGALLISFKNFSFAFTAWLTGARGLASGLSWYLTSLPY